MAAAVPVSFEGNHATLILLFAGKAGDSAIPSMNLSVNSTATAVNPERDPVKPVMKVKNDHVKRLTA